MLWLFEILACINTLVALFAITFTLYIYDGGVLLQLPFRISVNSLLSIYTVLFKAPLLFVLSSGIGQLQWT